MGRCESCAKEVTGDYKFCASCNQKYKEGQANKEKANQLKNLNMNLGHLTALYAKVHPKEEKELQDEWDAKAEEKEQEEKEREKLDEEEGGNGEGNA